MLLRDENVNVVKKAILTMTQLYKVALQVRTGWAFQKQLKPHQSWLGLLPAAEVKAGHIFGWHCSSELYSSPILCLS